MAQRVLLASQPEVALHAVRVGLEAAGHHVECAEDVEAVMQIGRAGKVDLVVVTEELGGGSGADVCMVLQDLPGHAPLLYVGEVLVPGADAVAPPDEPRRILEQALSLLEGAALIDSLGDMQGGEDPAEDRVSAAVRTSAAPDGPSPVAAPTTAKETKASVKDATKVDGETRRDAAFVEALLRRVREADYFEILGVGVESTPEEARGAHASLCASLAEAGAAVPRGRLEEIQAALDEARDVLCEPALRAAYTRNRP